MARYIVIIILPASFLTQQHPDEKAIFGKQCARFHSKHETKCTFLAKDLKQSKLEVNAIMLLIQNGKKVTPPYKKKLNTYEIKFVTDYVRKFRIYIQVHLLKIILYEKK